MYLAGPEAGTVAALWDRSNLDTRVLDGSIGSASALKAAYAGWTKGSAALLLAVRAYAEANGLGDEIIAEWETSIPGLADRAVGTARRIGRKAWRFEGEMAEIAVAMEDAGLPGGFHDAAREIYRRLSDLKGVEEQSVEDVNRRLLGTSRVRSGTPTMSRDPFREPDRGRPTGFGRIRRRHLYEQVLPMRRIWA